MRESALAKGKRYLTEGRLVVTRVDGPVIQAVCRGAGEVYELGHDLGRWYCSCPARRRCAHLEACMVVTAVVAR